MESKHYTRYIHIGKLISAERKSKGFSQQELAEKIGVSKSYISKIEAPNSYKSFSLEVLFDISDALEVPVNRFFLNLDKIEGDLFE